MSVGPESSSAPVVLGYWAIRGLAQPARLLLEYSGAEYVDKRYEVGPAPEFSRASWLEEKETLGLDFPNLPYLLDGEVKLTQSNSILRHLARKHGLAGAQQGIESQADMLSEQLMDLRNIIVRTAYCPAEKYDELYALAEKEQLPPFLDKLQAFVAKHPGPWAFGDSLTFCDFVLYELVDQIRLMFPDLFASRQEAWTPFLQDFEALPAIAAYMKTDKFLSRPVNNVTANFK